MSKTIKKSSVKSIKKNELQEINIEEKEINNKDESLQKDIKTTTNNLHNPFINTTLLCPIMLLPNQMDNKMYLNLKSNLNNKLIGKCYKNYGYIKKIYSIDEISDGVIEAEDISCSAKLIVKFSCSLCIPIINKELICKIDRMNKALISAINGPIKVIITSDKINKDNFFPDMNRNIRVKGTSEVVIPNMYIRILVLSKSFSDYDKNILVIGYLQDIATAEEIELYNKQNLDSDQNDFIQNEFEFID